MFKPFPNEICVDRSVRILESPKNRNLNNSGILPKKIKVIIDRKTDNEAKFIVGESSTIGRITDQFGKTLKKLDLRSDSIYYKRGEMTYKRYCDSLLEKVSALQRMDGTERSHVTITPWDEL